MHTAEQCGRAESFAHAQIPDEAGDDVVDFCIVMEGVHSVIDTSGDQEQTFLLVGPRGFVGEMNALALRASLVAWLAEAGAREIRLNLGELRRLLSRGASICEKWMTALLRRPEIFAQIDFVCAE